MKLIISVEIEKGDALSGADLGELLHHVLAVRDLAHGGRVRPQPQPEATRPESQAPARAEPDRGDAWEPPFDAFTHGRAPEDMGATPDEQTVLEPENPPNDGRQLLGWCAKQIPDAKGDVMSYGKRNGFPSKIVSWASAQVRAAYSHAKGTQRDRDR
jgi:hypothetical protein